VDPYVEDNHFRLRAMKMRDGMAAFYLLISTGMFLCILNYGLSNLLDAVCEHTDVDHTHQADKSKCGSKWGFKLVKQNIKPAPKSDVPPIPEIALLNRTSFASLEPSATTAKVYGVDSKSPPSSYSTPIFIKIRTILI
jgi:hypothetical protein